MLISWSGRGIFGLLVIAIPILGYAAFTAVSEQAAFAAMAVGLVIAGVLCFVLGKSWNAVNDVHRFGPFRLQTWGIVYGVLGLMLTWGAVRIYLEQHRSVQPRRPAAARPTTQ
jgi:hypothetical protein